MSSGSNQASQANGRDELRELVNMVVVSQKSFTPLKVLYPEQTRILDLGRQTLLYSITFHIAYNCTWYRDAADAFFERC
jgi:hypothetical protein